ncbi:MAG: cyclase family protein, partial [Clostridiales bacterium]|nr:cyclase family protein [Clostridiales bacterium]
KIVIVRTGFENKLGTSEYFDNIPKFDKKIGRILKKHGVRTIGFDFPSAETINGSRSMHKSILSREIVMIEGLVNLNEIPCERFVFSGFPIKLKGSDGSPIRAVAII